MKLPTLTALLVTTSAALSPAAYLTTDYPGSSQEGPPGAIAPPPPRTPPPSPDTPPEINRLIGQVTVGSPHTYGHLTIYPLEHRRPAAPAGVTTLEEAFARGWLEVRENRRPRVSVLQVRNNGRSPVFLLAGETLAGGKQDRLVRQDTLIPARSGSLGIAVYCIERERWSPAPKSFSPGGHLAHPGLRRGAARGTSQEGVWDEVKRRSANAGVESPTDNFHALYQDGALRKKVAACRPHFDGLPRAQTVGAVAVVAGRIVGADLFADPNLFAREWPKLFHSYALDYFSAGIRWDRKTSSRRRVVPDHGHLPAPGVTAFIRSTLAARYTPVPTPGEGRLLQISGTSTGEALLWRGQALHVGLFGAPYAAAPTSPPPFAPRPPAPLPHRR